MGVLYARVAGAWVPISSAGSPPPGMNWTTDPAQAGPRNSEPTKARFGNVNGSNEQGFFIDPAGFIDCSMAAGKSMALWDGTINGSGYIGKLYYPNAAGALDLGSLTLGKHTASGRHGLFLIGQGANGASPYFLLDGNYAIVNGGPWGALVCDRGTSVASFAQSGITLYTNTVVQGRVQSAWTYGGNDWSWANFMAEVTTGSGALAHYSFHNYYAPQFRGAQAIGEKIQVVDQSGNNFAPIDASAFNVNSALDTKRDIHSLRPQRERITVHHPPLTVDVPTPDIMSLRPVRYRPTRGPWIGIDDDGVEHPDPIDSCFGIQATRERLGLVADEVQHVIPSAVSHDPDGVPYAVDYAQITVALLDHVQALTDEVATLRYRITELEGAA